MQVRKVKVRILKILGKSILGLLLLLFGLVLLGHLPFVQRYITKQLPGYLSDRIGAKVELQKLSFSILGCLEMEGLKVWDPGDSLILSLDTLEVQADFFKLLKGDFQVQKIKLSHLYGHVTQDDDEVYSFQFMLDAFVDTENQDTTSSSFRFSCDTLMLEDIDFVFESTTKAVSLTSQLSYFSGTNMLISTSPMMIYADSLIVGQLVLDILSTSVPQSDADLSKEEPLIIESFIPDIGFGMKVNALSFQNNKFSFHVDSIHQTQKFDPAHVDVQRVDLEASDILLERESFSVNLREVKTQLPDFNLDQGSAALLLNSDQLTVSNLLLSAGQSRLNGDINLNSNPQLSIHPLIAMESKGQVAIEDFAYFIPDSLLTIFEHWPTTSFIFSLNPVGSGDQNIVLDIRTDQSVLNVSGELANIWDAENIAWHGLAVESTIGTDAKNFLANRIGEVNMPPKDINVYLTSNGDQKRAHVEGRLQSTWGDIGVNGDLIPNPSGLYLDLSLSGSRLMPGQFINTDWLGPTDLSITATGAVGNEQDLLLDGLISNIVIFDNAVQQIQFKSHLWRDSLTTTVSISDSNYMSLVQLNGDLSTPGRFLAEVQLDSFKLGQLMSVDSSIMITGQFKADATVDQLFLKAQLDGANLSVVRNGTHYAQDSLQGFVFLSPDSSYLNYQADDGEIELTANFDLRETKAVLNALTNRLFDGADTTSISAGANLFRFSAHLDDPGILVLAGMELDTFSSVRINSIWDEENQKFEFLANTGKIAAYGISYDTLAADFNALGNKLNAAIVSQDIHYQGVLLGELMCALDTKSDTFFSDLTIKNDSSYILGFNMRFQKVGEGIAVIPGELVVKDLLYKMGANNPLYFTRDSLAVDELIISRDDMRIVLDGNIDEFNLDLLNLNLENLNPILFPDSIVIDRGRLNGKMSFVRDQSLDLDASIEELVLLGSSPFSVALNAETNEGNIPFKLLIYNDASNIKMQGDYRIDQKEIDASLVLDIDSLHDFRVFYQPYLYDLQGAVSGESKVSGALENPDFKGHIRFRDMHFTTGNPKLTFSVKDDRIAFDNKGLALHDFVIFDNTDNPLYISGTVTNNEIEAVAYDLTIKTDEYALINSSPKKEDPLTGLLMLGTDIKLKGNEKDTYIQADILIKDTTQLVLLLPDKQSQLLSTEEVIEFVDPAQLLDASVQKQSESTYDSIIASLPDFALTSTIIIEEKAGLTILIDPQSGDFFQVAGKAKLDLIYDRTGNLMLNGTYEVTDGVYSLSFYDLVKKDFKLVKGSSIKWTGAPEDGALAIKAAYTIQSNSIGLVGHEVSENEKSVYKKSLDYEVGIDIRGTIESPEISFSLDLPEEDKITYPALANKLSRLEQPEFQSELNKQVFGLLVLGSFLPETSGAEGGQSDIATTALYNSVNSLLAGQLNKLAGQYIKGVDIDVGIQSYSDYASSGGQTKTSMDFHVSKRLINDRLVFEVGGDFDIGEDQSGANQGKSYRTDVAIIYDLTANGDKKLKLFNNESYDIIYQDIRNTGISLIFVREYDKGELKKKKRK